MGRGRAVVQSVAVSRAGHRWYASVLCKVTTGLPDRPTRCQRECGTVGVDLGVKQLAALSQPLDPDDPATLFVTNPRHVRQAERRLAKARRALWRTQKGSARRAKPPRTTPPNVVGRAPDEPGAAIAKPGGVN
ncbi:transposase [Streptomyces sp. NPDC032161]|uniref:transposase n=1 Tax=unclassified Streptomyces TaxID=2593676 RepID=UPI0033D5A3F6